MTWIQTETISVPAHANQTTVSEAGARTRATVALNEWFQANHSFLLGNPRANQLRGTAGGWVQTLAIAPQPGQDTIALLRDRLTQILKGNINNEVYHVATVIPADRFESNSPYAFILRENPKAQGVEIHFPPDSTPAPDFIARIAAAGFEKAKSNPHLWYSKYSDELIGKARGWVKACQKHGAYEISSNVPVEQTKSRRRGKSASKPSMLPTAAPAVGNKVVDAVCDRVQAMLLQMKEELTVNNSELDVLRAENERLKAELHSLRQERERLDQVIQSQRETIDVGVKEVERLSDVVEERNRTITKLRSSLAEWGVESPVEDTPVFEDEAPDSPVFDDEPVGEDVPVFDDDVLLAVASDEHKALSETEEGDSEEGFDLDSLDLGD